jgi:hypothetical protein
MQAGLCDFGEMHDKINALYIIFNAVRGRGSLCLCDADTKWYGSGFQCHQSNRQSKYGERKIKLVQHPYAASCASASAPQKLTSHKLCKIIKGMQ